MNEQLYGEFYDAEYVEYSPAHDSYFVYFSGGPNPSGEMGTTRHIGVYYRFFPFFVWYDSMYPGWLKFFLKSFIIFQDHKKGGF